MRVIAIDTALGACSVAALDGQIVCGHRFLDMNRGHAEVLMGLVDEVEAEAGFGVLACDRLAVTVGPGTFTGLRVGLAAARGFALASGKPLVGLTTLHAIAAGAEGEMIEKVAQHTGISFPHRFERYVELSLIAYRPLDRWNIAKATTKELRLQLFACAVQKELKEAGIEFQGLPCKALCMASFKAAADKTGDDVRMELDKTLPQDNVCEFAFFCR